MEGLRGGNTAFFGDGIDGVIGMRFQQAGDMFFTYLFFQNLNLFFFPVKFVFISQQLFDRRNQSSVFTTDDPVMTHCTPEPYGQQEG